MSESEFIDAVEKIYAASVDPTVWDHAVRRMVQLLHGRGGLLIGIDPGRIRPIVHGVADLPEQAMAEYQAEWAAKDPRMRRLLQAPAGKIFTEEMFFSQREMDRDPYYDWLQGWGFRYAIGSQLHRADRFAAFFSVQYAPEHGAPDAPTIETYARIAPHLARAVAISSRLDAVQASHASLAATLDALSTPVLVVNRALRVLFANTAAEHLLKTGPLRSAPATGLVGPDGDSTRALRQIVLDVAALTDRMAHDAPGVARIPRPPPLPALAVTAMPLLSRTRTLPTGAVAALFISDPLQAPIGKAVQELLRTMYPLTPGEAEIVAGLATGESVESLALKRGSTPATIVTQIKSALRKTGAENRSELIRLGLSLVAVFRR